LLALPAAMGAEAQQPPTRIFVEGRPVALVTGLPAYREGRLFLPVQPIALELRDAVSVEIASQSVQVQLGSSGERRIFDRLTGEVRREGLVLGVFPDARDIAIAYTPEAQQLPLDVLSLLLDVTIQVKPGESEVHIRRSMQLDLATQTTGRLPVQLDRVEYTETLGVLDGAYGHTMRLSSRAQVFDSRVTSTVEYTGGSGRTFLNFLSGSVIAERPSGQTWIAGDFAAGPRSRLVSTPARGLSLEQPLGRNRLIVFGGAALTQATVGAGSFSLRDYRTGIFGALWSNQAMVRGTPGLGWELGGVHFAEGQRRGTLFVQQFSRRTGANLLHVDSGFGHFRSGSGAAASAGPAFGVDLVDSLSLGRQTLVLRASHYGDRFLTPQAGDSTRGRTLFSAAWAGPVHPHLTLGLSAAHTRVRVPFAQANNNYTWSAAYTHHAWLPDVSASQTVATGGTGSFNNLQFNLSRVFRRLRPTLSFNRLAFEQFAVHSTSAGLGVEAGKWGQFNGYQSFSGNGQRSGALDWNLPAIWHRRLQLTAGAGYESQPSTAGLAQGARLTVRAGGNLRLPFGNTLQFNFQQSGLRREFRFTLGGPLFARGADLAAPVVGSSANFALPSAIAGRLYQDIDMNGRFDAGVDLPLARTRVWLDSTLLADTDAYGMYRFPAVFPGPHVVQVDVTTLRADFTSLNPMERRMNVPARSAITADFSFVQTGALSGTVWFDSNRNGVQDENEEPASDLRILCSCGKETPTTADGVFILGDMLPGEVLLTVDLQTVAPQFEVAPKQVRAVVLSGKRGDGLRFAIQPKPRRVEEHVLPPQQLGSGPAGPAGTGSPAALAPRLH
jgi:hypothetical protein